MLINSQKQESKENQDDSKRKRFAIHVIGDLLGLPPTTVATATTAPETTATNEKTNGQQSTKEGDGDDPRPPRTKLRLII